MSWIGLGPPNNVCRNLAYTAVLLLTSISPSEGLQASEKEAKMIGDAARQHVQRTFSRPAFGSKLQAILEGMLENKQKNV